MGKIYVFLMFKLEYHKTKCQWVTDKWTAVNKIYYAFHTIHKHSDDTIIIKNLVGRNKKNTFMSFHN